MMNNRRTIESSFSVWLKEAITRRCISQKVLTAKSGIAQSTISMLINAERAPSRTTVYALAAALIPCDADTNVQSAMIRDALYAAGYAAPQELERIPEYPTWIAGYRNAPHKYREQIDLIVKGILTLSEDEQEE